MGLKKSSAFMEHKKGSKNMLPLYSLHSGVYPQKLHLSSCFGAPHITRLLLPDFSSGLTVHWISVCACGTKWAVVIEAWAGAGHQCQG